MGIDTVELWFGIANGQISSNLTELSARDMPIVLFLDDNLRKCQGILTKLGTCIGIKEIWFWIANGKISSGFERVICPRHDNGGVLSFYVLISSLKSITITKTCLYNFDPLKPHFYIVKLGFKGVYIIFLISAQTHRLWVLVRTASPRRF